MVWAAVPEAPVEVNGDACAGEYKICGAPEARYRSRGNSVSETPGMDRGPEGDFGPGVSRTIATHDDAGRW